MVDPAPANVLPHGPGASNVAAGPAGDAAAWLAIFSERQAADPTTAHAQTLTVAFRDARISGSSARARLHAILTLTGSSVPGPDTHFDVNTIRAIGTASALGVGDTGFRREFRDSVYYHKDASGADVTMHTRSSDQVGHFLTAVHFGYFIQDGETYYAAQENADAQYRSTHPYLSVLRELLSPTEDLKTQFETQAFWYQKMMIGHEMIADDTGLGSHASPLLASPFMASADDVSNFFNNRLDLIRVDDSVVGSGNSYQDLLLTWVGYRFGQRVATNQFPSLSETSRWLELMLTERDLSLVQAGDAFEADARDMQTMLRQFVDIQQRIHP